MTLKDVRSNRKQTQICAREPNRVPRRRIEAAWDVDSVSVTGHRMSRQVLSGRCHIVVSLSCGIEPRDLSSGWAPCS